MAPPEHSSSAELHEQFWELSIGIGGSLPWRDVSNDLLGDQLDDDDHDLIGRLDCTKPDHMGAHFISMSLKTCESALTAVSKKSKRVAARYKNIFLRTAMILRTVSII